MREPTKLFLSYAREDKIHCEVLKKWLGTEVQNGSFEFWYDRMISPGEDWNSKIKKALNEADIFIVLLSIDCIRSKYIQSVEIKEALARHSAGDLKIIPILVRACEKSDWGPLAKLQVLPRATEEGWLAILEYKELQDTAWKAVGNEIKELAASIRTKPKIVRNKQTWKECHIGTRIRQLIDDLDRTNLRLGLDSIRASSEKEGMPHLLVLNPADGCMYKEGIRFWAADASTRGLRQRIKHIGPLRIKGTMEFDGHQFIRKLCEQVLEQVPEDLSEAVNCASKVLSGASLVEFEVSSEVVRNSAAFVPSFSSAWKEWCGHLANIGRKLTHIGVIRFTGVPISEGNQSAWRRILGMNVSKPKDEGWTKGFASLKSAGLKYEFSKPDECLKRPVVDAWFNEVIETELDPDSQALVPECRKQIEEVFKETDCVTIRHLHDQLAILIRRGDHDGAADTLEEPRFRLFDGSEDGQINGPTPQLNRPNYERLLDPSRYVLSPDLRDAVHVALWLRKPLLITGEPGTGKTQLAKVISRRLGNIPLRSYQTQTKSEAGELFYQYDHIRRFHDANLKTEGRLLSPREYISYGPLGQAILDANHRSKIEKLLPANGSVKSYSPDPKLSVVLIDEVDKAPRDFPNDILAQIESLSFRIRELPDEPEVKASDDFRPILIFTSNSEKHLPDAFLRRCIYHHIEFPSKETLEKIILKRIDFVSGNDRKAALELFFKIREDSRIQKRPATAELLDWLVLLDELGKEHKDIWKATTESGKAALETSLSCLVKNRDDRPVAEDLLKRVLEAGKQES